MPFFTYRENNFVEMNAIICAEICVFLRGLGGRIRGLSPWFRYKKIWKNVEKWLFRKNAFFASLATVFSLQKKWSKGGVPYGLFGQFSGVGMKFFIFFLFLFIFSGFSDLFDSSYGDFTAMSMECRTPGGFCMAGIVGHCDWGDFAMGNEANIAFSRF